MSRVLLYSPAAVSRRASPLFGWYSFPVRWGQQAELVSHPSTNRSRRTCKSTSLWIRQTAIIYSNFSKTSGSAIAEGPRDVLVSTNSATTKYRYRVALFAWSYVQPFLHNTEVWQTHPYRRTDRYTTTACTALSIASRGKNRPYCTAHQVQLPGNERRLIANF